MDCRTARLLLDFVRPLAPELEAGEAEGLHDHLVDCPECRSIVHTERHLDDHIGQAVRAVPVPTDLQARILARLQRERKTWYRRRLWAPVTGAAAAVLLLAVWFGLGHHKPRVAPNLDFHALNLQAGSRPDQVENWFKESQHLVTVVPPQFNYNYLDHYGLTDFQGTPVPFLFFIRETVTARVYILSDKQFDLNNLEAKAAGYQEVEVLYHPTDPHVAYVVVYNVADHKDWLLDKQQGPAA